MSINNMSDKELDDLFKKSADSFEPPYDPEAWTDMEEKLDSIQGEQPWWYKLLFPVLILIYSSSILTVMEFTEKSATAFSKSTSETAAVHNSMKSKTVETSDVQNKRPTLNNDQEHLRVAHSSSLSATGEFSGSADPEAPETLQNNSATHTSTAPFTATLTDDAEVQLNQPLRLRRIEQHHPSVHSPVLGAAKLNPNTNQEQILTADTSAHRNKIRHKSGFLSSLEIGALVAPDITTVKFKDPDAISVNAGMVLGIPISKKFSIITGLIWANKVYGAKPESYSPSPDYWNGKYMPVSIDAACQVLDIPLNISYRVLDWGKNSINLQAGLSSYIMFKENYTYNYANGYGNYSKTIKYKNDYEHWFGVQNLSVSYKRKLSPAISVGVEPFVKIPLTGIGAGHIKLSSAGVFFSGGYTLRLKK